MNDKPLIEFDSHVAGKNATVRLWPDRVEWKQGGWMGSGSKAALGALTFGASLVVTGVRGKKDESMIPVRSINSVTNKKSGLTKTMVVVNTSGGAIEFRCSGSQAEKFKSLLLQQMANGGQDPHPQAPQQQATPPQQAAPAATPAGNPVMEQLQQLAGLRDAGVLSEEEFQAKKTELLGKL